MSGIRAKQRALAKVIRMKPAGAVCTPKIVIGKGGARGCSSCGAKASTAKTVLVCARTGRLPGVKA